MIIFDDFSKSFDDQPLMTASMRQACLEEKMSRYERVVIRVQFADRLVLQGIFRPRETLHNVEKFVKEHLENKSSAFYLCKKILLVVLDVLPESFHVYILVSSVGNLE